MSTKAAHGDFFPGIDLVVTGGLGLWALVPSLISVSSMARQLLGFPAVLFAPGYGLVAVLFARRRLLDRESNQAHGVSPLERLVLAVGLSVCLVPLFGIGLIYLSMLRPSTFLRTTGAVTVLLTIAAAGRRLLLPPHERFVPRPFNRGYRAISEATVGSASVLTVLLVVSLLTAGAGIGVAAFSTDSHAEFTEFYITTPDAGQPGDVASGYPENLSVTPAVQLRIGITNSEREPMSYTVVVQLQSIVSGQVQAAQELDRFGVSVPRNTTVHRNHTLDQNASAGLLAGSELRLVYLLYVGSAPAETDVTTETAYRYVHIWVATGESV
jgi:uncharacterized membrane protein